MEVSIITASYNCEKFIEETLNSILAQTYKNWQLIIFDDGSTDASRDIIRRYAQADARIKLFCHPDNKNLGLSATLAKALSCVKTEYTAFLECDDIWTPDHLAQKIAFLRHNAGADIIFNDVQCFGFKERVKKLTVFNYAVKVYLKLLNPFSTKYNLNFPLMSFNPIPTFSCVMMRTSLAEEYGFDSPFAPAADYWLWVRLSFRHDFNFINNKLTFWRLRPDSYTMRTKKDIKGDRNLRKAVKELYKKNLSTLSYWFKAGLSNVLGIIFYPIDLIVKPLARLLIIPKK